MKEFEKPIPQIEEIEIVDQNQQEKQLVIGNVIMHKGHTMFEINCSTGEIAPVKFESTNANFVSGAVKRKITIKPNCLYVPCLNLRNAQKKFAKFILEQTRPVI